MSKVLVVCDVGPSLGVGHLMRCIALAEEFRARGDEAVFSADVAGVPWAARQLERRGFRVLATPAYDDVAGLVAQVEAIAPTVVVLDSYQRPAEAYAAVRRAAPLLAIVDGDPRGREADVYLDQNIGAELDVWPLPGGSVRLAGLDYCLIRDDVLVHRPAAPGKQASGLPRVLMFFGGTDAFGAAPVLSRALVATEAPFEATVVAATPVLDRQVREIPVGAGQRVTTLGPTDDLARLVAAADLVISAAGTSSWELCCIGAASALVCVAENQADSYQRVVGLGVVEGAGTLMSLRQDHDPAVRLLRGLLRDPAQRDVLRRRAWQLVDGCGRARVVDAVIGTGHPSA